MATNATRFISAYNRLDAVLRSKYNLKSNVTFSEAVRLSASRSPVVRKYEDDLMDYARLRNAIVHKSESGKIIAEPHDSVVETIEHIVDLVSAPPRADKTVAKAAVTLQAETKLIDAIRLMAKSNFSNVPVLREGAVVGVASNKRIVEALAKNLDGDLDRYIRFATVGETLTNGDEHYALAPADITVDEVLQLFENRRKLQIVVLTLTGAPEGDLCGVITTGDILQMKKLLD